MTFPRVFAFQGSGFKPRSSAHSVSDFTGNGAAAGDSLRFVGFGVGATLTQVGSSDYWAINSGASTETIRLAGVTSLHATDYLFAP